VSYHFPTKEALIVALVEKTHAENNATVAAPEGALDFEKLGAIIRAIMQRDLENQWLMRDAVGLLVISPALREIQTRMQRAREARVDVMVERLIAAQLLDRVRAERGLPLLRQQILTQVFFWIPSAILAAPDRDPAERIDLHVRAVLALFLPYCTAAGKRSLESLIASRRSTRRSRSS